MLFPAKHKTKPIVYSKEKTHAQPFMNWVDKEGDVPFDMPERFANPRPSQKDKQELTEAEEKVRREILDRKDPKPFRHGQPKRDDRGAEFRAKNRKNKDKKSRREDL